MTPLPRIHWLLLHTTLQRATILKQGGGGGTKVGCPCQTIDPLRRNMGRNGRLVGRTCKLCKNKLEHYSLMKSGFFDVSEQQGTTSKLKKIGDRTRGMPSQA